MEKLDTYKVDLRGMKSDSSTHSWEVDDAFFDAVEAPEVHTGHVRVCLTVRREHEAYELCFAISGVIQVPCDRCLEPMDLAINTSETLKARMGAAYDDDGQWLTVPEADGMLNVAWYIYEFIALQIPIRHVHPDGQCIGLPTAAILTEDTDTGDPAPAADPRWDKLKTIFNNK